MIEIAKIKADAIARQAAHRPALTAQQQIEKEWNQAAMAQHAQLKRNATASNPYSTQAANAIVGTNPYAPAYVEPKQINGVDMVTLQRQAKAYLDRAMPYQLGGANKAARAWAYQQELNRLISGAPASANQGETPIEVKPFQSNLELGNTTHRTGNPSIRTGQGAINNPVQQIPTPTAAGNAGAPGQVSNYMPLGNGTNALLDAIDQWKQNQNDS